MADTHTPLRTAEDHDNRFFHFTFDLSRLTIPPMKDSLKNLPDGKRDELLRDQTETSCERRMESFT